MDIAPAPAGKWKRIQDNDVNDVEQETRETRSNGAGPITHEPPAKRMKTQSSAKISNTAIPAPATTPIPPTPNPPTSTPPTENPPTPSTAMPNTHPVLPSDEPINRKPPKVKKTFTTADELVDQVKGLAFASTSPSTSKTTISKSHGFQGQGTERYLFSVQ